MEQLVMIKEVGAYSATATNNWTVLPKSNSVVTTGIFSRKCANILSYLSFLFISLKIDNHEERGYPANDTELYEVIFDKRFCGTSA